MVKIYTMQAKRHYYPACQVIHLLKIHSPLIFRSDKYIETGGYSKCGSMEVECKINLLKVWKFGSNWLRSSLPHLHTSILFEVHLHSLVKEMVLKALIGKIL